MRLGESLTRVSHPKEFTVPVLTLREAHELAEEMAAFGLTGVVEKHDVKPYRWRVRVVGVHDAA